MQSQTPTASSPVEAVVLTVRLGDELFRFESFQRWVNKASDWFADLRCGTQYVCIDSAGRICQTGKQFMRARDEETFPIVVYSIG